ncbi:MAG: isoprenylcysteine carboxylmethyltransferase family protein [Bacteroidota bacterium]
MRKLYIPPTLIVYCFLSMVLLYFFVPQYNFIRFPYNLIGLLIAFLGFTLMGKARDLFKKHQTSLNIEKSNQLIREGVFSKTRNPMYVGMCILVIGFSILSTNVIALSLPFIFLVLVNLIYIKKEEHLMFEEFGEEYIEYKKKVRRFI